VQTSSVQAGAARGAALAQTALRGSAQ